MHQLQAGHAIGRDMCLRTGDGKAGPQEFLDRPLGAAQAVINGEARRDLL